MITYIADQLLQFISHRPYPLPNKEWLLYQQWNDVLFLHSPITPEQVRPLLPNGLQLDITSGVAWLSVVAFGVTNARTRLLPVIPLLPAFTELHLRTYVKYDNIPGIYFLQIKANSDMAVLMNKAMTKLRYQYADIMKIRSHRYFMRVEPESLLDIDFHPGPFFHAVPALDRWLTERYCCYQDDGPKLYRYDIHHPVWPLYNVQTNYHLLQYHFHDLQLTNQSIHLLHYSPLQTALIWKRKQVA